MTRIAALISQQQDAHDEPVDQDARRTAGPRAVAAKLLDLAPSTCSTGPDRRQPLRAGASPEGATVSSALSLTIDEARTLLAAARVVSPEAYALAPLLLTTGLRDKRAAGHLNPRAGTRLR